MFMKTQLLADNRRSEVASAENQLSENRAVTKVANRLG